MRCAGGVNYLAPGEELFSAGLQGRRSERSGGRARAGDSARSVSLAVAIALDRLVVKLDTETGPSRQADHALGIDPDRLF
jgi:hypothetical protein